MRKYLKVFGFSTLVALIFSMPQKTQCMDCCTEDLDKNLSVPSVVLHFEQETYDVLNQEIIDHDRVCSQNKKNNNLIDYQPLIKQSARLIKEAAMYTLEHPIQAALIGLSCQIAVVNALESEDVIYGTGTAWVILQAIGMSCDTAATFGNYSTNTTHNLNICNHVSAWSAWGAAFVTGAIIFWKNKCKGKKKSQGNVELLPTNDTSYPIQTTKRR